MDPSEIGGGGINIKINSHMKMLKASNNQLPFLTRICISSLSEWPKNMIIYKPENANESAKTTKHNNWVKRRRKKFPGNIEQMDGHYLRPLSLASLSSAISSFKRLRKDTVEGYCSLLASISFNSNCISYTYKIHDFVTLQHSIHNKQSHLPITIHCLQQVQHVQLS